MLGNSATGEARSVPLLSWIAGRKRERMLGMCQMRGTAVCWPGCSPTESDASLYDLYIGAEGGVKANENCSYAFAGFENAGQITFAGHFDTGETVSMVGMFQGCVGLTGIDLEGFRTEKVREFDRCFPGATA